MDYEPVSSAARTLLSEIINDKKPTKLLRDKYDLIQEKVLLCSNLGELESHGLIKIQWANNKPYHVIVTASGRAYEEKLAEHVDAKNGKQAISITVGSNNKISKSVIAGIINIDEASKDKNYFEKHPVICGFLISLLVGIVLLFSFWSQIIRFVEGLF